MALLAKILVLANLGLLAKIKRSLCSYQFNESHWAVRTTLYPHSPSWRPPARGF